MVSIEDCSSKHPIPQRLKGDERQQDGSKAPDDNHNTGREDNVPVILAKAAIAAKMQIFAGAENRSSLSVPLSEGSDGHSIRQRGGNEDNMVRNLKAIVADDHRWELFALGALGLPPTSGSGDTVRNCLQKGFEEDVWDGIANLAAMYSQSAGDDENACTSAPTDGLTAGMIQRTKLWLTFTDYFENLFSAIQEKNLSNNIDLYTDELLIQYLGTIGQ